VKATPDPKLWTGVVDRTSPFTLDTLAHTPATFLPTETPNPRRVGRVRWRWGARAGRSRTRGSEGPRPVG